MAWLLTESDSTTQLKRQRSGCEGQQPCCLVQQCVSNESRERKWSSSSMCIVISSLSISNNISSSPVNVGGLPNHVKYCITVLSLQLTTIRTSPVGIPNKFFNNVRERPLTNLGNKRVACWCVAASRNGSWRGEKERLR